MTPIRPALLTIPIALAARAPAPGEPAAEGDTAALINEAKPDDCPLMVWSDQETRDLLDRANDLVDGGAISCATGTSPGQFQAAIAALRDAARSGDKARMLEQVGIPLLYIDGDGERVELAEEDVETLYDEVFDDELIRVLERLDLKDMTVNEQGGFFELGSVWLVVEKRGGRPQLVTVNRQALEESAEAARRAAESDQGATLGTT